MTKRIEIKPATAADQAALSEIYLVDRQQDFPWVTDPQLQDFNEDSRGEFVLVAWIDGQRAGFCSLYRLANFIHLLFVAPDFRHLKVGERLLTEMRQYATEPLTLKCVMANENALRFYAQVGFRIVKADADALPPNYTLRDTHTEQYVALVDVMANERKLN
ncbi:GNAT family N-acetyltransferase [Lactiplantibacillus plantarum]|uniref:GNAT family N-acetyltransferase n=1 Tax=Lactiplantibacillus plantarum TaxID=1590 RepID=UPI000C176348|nr:GNAT family N-acetyltransferase [Lactiplantibacillus plantarum]PKX80510.1 N-acetyltransferase [Lactiplantibacillus plantarum]